MKQDLDDNSPVTKKQLKIILQDYPTKKDLQTELTKFGKKLENRLEDRLDQKFAERLQNSMEAFRRETDHKMLVQDEKWDRRFADFESKIQMLLDPLFQDVKIRNEERIIAAAQLHTVQHDVENLQKRVTKLENA